MISKDEYILTRVNRALEYYASKGKKVKPETLPDLIEQWWFDYDMDKAYRPEELRKENLRKTNSERTNYVNGSD